jgi:hypothetical protein
MTNRENVGWKSVKLAKQCDCGRPTICWNGIKFYYGFLELLYDSSIADNGIPVLFSEPPSGISCRGIMINEGFTHFLTLDKPINLQWKPATKLINKMEKELAKIN